MATETMERRETGYPWYDRHAVYRCREIYEWHINGRHHIGGAEWDSNERIYTRYATWDGDKFGPPMVMLPGFVFCPRVIGDGFPSWEAAEEWLFGKGETP